jgi:hypothetical protein
MKIIDQTPFYNEKGEISLSDRLKAILKFGTNWITEVEAQREVMSVLGNLLDKNYTLLHNVTLVNLDTSIPFILVGPTGVLVMYVTPQSGMIRIKGDLWGTISGNSFKVVKPNLMTRTERMARAVQLYLHRQGFSEMLMVEAVLLCSNPSVHVDSQRPIIRVVMRDALERFAVSIAQARVIMDPDAVQDIVNRIVSGPKRAQKPVPAAAHPAPKPVPTASQPVHQSAPVSPAGNEKSELPSYFEQLSGDPMGNSVQPAADEEVLEPIQNWGLGGTSEQATQEAQEELRIQWAGVDSLPQPVSAARASARRRTRFNKKQWGLLIGFFVFWVILMAVFLFLVVKDLYL